jgi:DNA-binding NarL/FixJ family response regulator
MSVLLAEASNLRPTAVREDTEPISVLIWSKDPISKAGVALQLQALADISLLSTTSATRHPDVVLLVADTLNDDVLGLIPTIRKASMSRIAIVASATGQAAAWATEAGASGVLPRSMADSRRLAWFIRKVHRGDTVALFVADERGETLPTMPERPPEKACPTVSERDRHVLRLLAEGCDTGEIARALAYSEPTIKNAIQRLFDQLEAKNRPHAVALALRSGII